MFERFDPSRATAAARLAQPIDILGIGLEIGAETQGTEMGWKAMRLAGLPQPTGNPGGYCSRVCRIDEDCTSTGTENLAEGLCLGISQTTALCFRGCAAPLGGQSNCRPGYVCETLQMSDGGFLPTGFCDGRCDVPGSRCGNFADGGARACLSTGYCQR